MSVTKTIHNLPEVNLTAITTDTELYTWVNTFVAAFAQAIGYVVREDLTTTAPSYASNTYVKFIAKDATSDPDFCFHPMNSTNFSTKKSNFFITPCTYSAGVWMPSKIPTGTTGTSNSKSTDNLYTFKLNTNKFFQIEKLELGNNKTLITIYHVTKSTSQRDPSGTTSFCIMLGYNIYYNNVAYQKPIFISRTIGIPYIEEIETEINTKTIQELTVNSASTTGVGFAPQIGNNNIEFLIKLPKYWVNENCYLRNIYIFSNKECQDIGKSVLLDNIRYYVIYSMDDGSTTTRTACFLIREEEE